MKEQNEKKIGLLKPSAFEKLSASSMGTPARPVSLCGADHSSNWGRYVDSRLRQFRAR